MNFEQHPSFEGLERIEDALLLPPKESPERPFYRAVYGYAEELTAYLDDIDNAEAFDTLPESRDNLLSAHKVLAYAIMEDKGMNDIERARLLGGWQVTALSKINSDICKHPTTIKLVEGPWNKEEFEEDSTKDPQAKLVNQIILAIHESKADPNRKSPSDSMKAADRIHEDFSVEVSMILYRLMDTFGAKEDETEENSSTLPTSASPIDSSESLSAMISDTEDITQFLLGKVSLDIDEGGINTAEWDIETDTKD